jgi:hypothetical protein
MNRISIKESQKERSVEAVFTDKVAVDVAGLWSSQNSLGARIIPKLNMGRYDSSGEASSNGGLKTGNKINSDVNVGIDESEAIDTSVSASFSGIFGLEKGKPVLRDTNLKGQSNKDYRIRATVLTLSYMAKEHSAELLPRADLVEMLKKVDWFDTNYYAELKDRSIFFIDDEERVGLVAHGQKLARQYVAEVFDDSIKPTPLPKVGAQRKKPAKNSSETPTDGNEKSGSTKSASSRRQGPNIEKYVEKWDKRAGNATYAMETRSRLDQVLVGLTAFQQVQDDEKPVSRNELQAFLREAFGVSYSAKAIAERLSKEDGKQLVRHVKNKGYRLRETGEARAKELMGTS